MWATISLREAFPNKLIMGFTFRIENKNKTTQKLKTKMKTKKNKNSACCLSQAEMEYLSSTLMLPVTSQAKE